MNVRNDIIKKLLYIDLILVLLFACIVKLGNSNWNQEYAYCNEGNNIAEEKVLTQEQQNKYWEIINEKNKKAKQEKEKVVIQNGRPGITKDCGVYYFNGMKETWYSSKAGMHYMTREMTLDGEGFYHYWHNGVNCYVVAIKGLDKFTHIEISKGEAIVLDTPANYGVVDVYVNW